MDYTALILPILLIIGLFIGLVVLKRRLFEEDSPPPPIPIPDAAISKTGAPEYKPSVETLPVQSSNGGNDVNLSPSRLYPRAALNNVQMTTYARLLKALPGYVVLPQLTYDHFLEARDGTPSENKSLQNRAAQQVADFVICDKRLRVLLVCQVEDGTHLPARTEERQRMLEKTGLRMLRWNVKQPPDPDKLLKTVQTLEKLGAQTGEPASGQNNRARN